MIAYKLFRKRSNGTYGSLFIDKKKNYVINVQYYAEEHETKGYKLRPYFHVCLKPEAPHLSVKNRVWCEVEVNDFTEFDRPECQGGKWILSKDLIILGEVKSNT
jgi:hypothetical protein